MNRNDDYRFWAAIRFWRYDNVETYRKCYCSASMQVVYHCAAKRSDGTLASAWSLGALEAQNSTVDAKCAHYTVYIHHLFNNLLDFKQITYLDLTPCLILASCTLTYIQKIVLVF